METKFVIEVVRPNDNYPERHWFNDARKALKYWKFIRRRINIGMKANFYILSLHKSYQNSSSRIEEKNIPAI
jgi:hypothetical protein